MLHLKLLVALFAGWAPAETMERMLNVPASYLPVSPRVFNDAVLKTLLWPQEQLLQVYLKSGALPASGRVSRPARRGVDRRLPPQ